ncbi:MAG TPA: MBL fold metallo-hydrolase [Ruminiclostridium sp.]|nr:MBL fold metallo-hydrolase [Ruminiclostridium sp.]
MEKYKINDNLFLFNSYIEAIGLSFNQYLICNPSPMLIHTGSVDQTEQLVPGIKEILGDQPLEYVFISHFESDECGGLELLKKNYSGIKAICSSVTARQLTGFGIDASAVIVNPGQKMEIGDSSFEFIAYPSEMHLWEGLMAFEAKQGILFSSDVFIRMGKIDKPVAESSLSVEVEGIGLQKVPSPEALKRLQKDISALSVKYIMPGHGPCLKII